MDRIKMTSLSLSASAIISIAIHEGFRSEAYTPVKGDVATIGFGITENVKPTDTITVDGDIIGHISSNAGDQDNVANDGSDLVKARAATKSDLS